MEKLLGEFGFKKEDIQNFQNVEDFASAVGEKKRNMCDQYLRFSDNPQKFLAKQVADEKLFENEYSNFDENLDESIEVLQSDIKATFAEVLKNLYEEAKNYKNTSFKYSKSHHGEVFENHTRSKLMENFAAKYCLFSDAEFDEEANKYAVKFMNNLKGIEKMNSLKKEVHAPYGPGGVREYVTLGNFSHSKDPNNDKRRFSSEPMIIDEHFEDKIKRQQIADEMLQSKYCSHGNHYGLEQDWGLHEFYCMIESLPLGRQVFVFGKWSDKTLRSSFLNRPNLGPGSHMVKFPQFPEAMMRIGIHPDLTTNVEKSKTYFIASGKRGDHLNKGNFVENPFTDGCRLSIHYGMEIRPHDGKYFPTEAVSFGKEHEYPITKRYIAGSNDLHMCEDSLEPKWIETEKAKKEALYKYYRKKIPSKMSGFKSKKEKKTRGGNIVFSLIRIEYSRDYL